MSRQNRRLTCAYCRQEGGTNEHVFARAFFLERDRPNLPTAPACEKCNGRKAQYENYATAILPFAGRHDACIELLEAAEAKLQSNQKLLRDLRDGQGFEVVQTEDYRYEMRATLPIDFEPILRLFEMIAHGLIWHHWEYLLPHDCGVRAIAMNSTVTDTYLRELTKGRDYTEAVVGDASFKYEGLRAVDADRSSVWRFQIFGGAEFGVSGSAEIINEVLVTTGKQDFIWDLIDGEAA
ncbi:MAG: hypothetical protein NW200_14490 [Hyphomonadaceae bacterium]|nr:hypothetical protein [Hyphomonadaceae bacterium]